MILRWIFQYSLDYFRPFPYRMVTKKMNIAGNNPHEAAAQH